MGRVRVFYGHEGVVPPTGLRSRSAAPAQPEPEEVDEIVADSSEGEPVELVGEPIEDGDELLAPAGIVRVDGTEVPVGDDGIPVLTEADEVEEEVGGVELPDDSWTKGDLLAFADVKGIDMTGATKTKPAALARILESLKEQ